MLLPPTVCLGPLLPSHPPCPTSRLETSFARRLSRPFAAPAPSGHSLPGPGTAVGLLAWDIAGSIHQPSIPPSTHPNPPTQHCSSPRPASRPHALDLMISQGASTPITRGLYPHPAPSSERGRGRGRRRPQRLEDTGIILLGLWPAPSTRDSNATRPSRR